MRRFLALLLLLAACDGDPDATTAAPIEDPAPAPDGPLVAAVYTADNDLDGAHELYAIDSLGGIVNLSHGVGDGHHVASFALAADERSVAFAVEGGGLYVSPVGENAPVMVSGAGLVVEEFAWSPDGSRLAYRATASPAQLYLVNPDGSGHVNPTGGVDEVGTRVRWSFDGAWLAFHWDNAVPGQQEVYVVRADGSGLQRITQTAADPTAARYVHYSWAPTANCLAVRTDPTGSPGLYVADVGAGTPPVRVSTGDVEPDRWEWSPDGSALAYRHPHPATQLRAVSIVSKQGGDDRLVSGDVVVSDHEWSPDGTRVAFLDNESLHVADVGEIARDTKIGSFAWSPSSDRLAYLAGDLTLDELWTVDVPGGAPTFVGEDVLAFAWDPPAPLAQLDEDTLRVIREFTAFTLTRAMAGVWEGQKFTPYTVLPEHTRRARFHYAAGRPYVDAQVFIGGNAFFHSLSEPEALALSVGLNAVIVPLSRPVAAGDFRGFLQSLNTAVAISTGTFPVIWYANRNAEARSMSVVEWNEIFRGQVAPQVYVSVGLVPDGTIDFDVTFQGVDFDALAELSFAPAIVSVALRTQISRWIASGRITPGDGSDVKLIDSEASPEWGVVSGPTLYLDKELTQPFHTFPVEERLVEVLAVAGDALLIQARGVIGWVDAAEVEFEE